MTMADDKVVLFGRSDRPSAEAEQIHSRFRSMIANEGYPCVGGKAAINRGSYQFGVYDKMGGEGATAGLSYDLYNFMLDHSENGFDSPFSSFVAAFSDTEIKSEMDFHGQLWNQLQLVHELDRQHHQWDSTVSSDISSPYFAFSFASQALFIVGLNPLSSRVARRFPWPVIVFNPHSQFRLMRELDTFSAMQTTIRKRDLALQGSLNPNLADFGTDSEAKQYSGMAATGDMVCPFKAKSPKI